MRATILENPWIKVQPTLRQAEFLLTPEREAMYGGAAGGGKSIALFMGALQYVDVPGYAALLIRRTYTDLSLPGALIDISHQWLNGTKAKWSGENKTWTFPSGAHISFGHMEAEKDRFRYQGAMFQYVGWDELTQFSESQYRYLFSRTRRPKDGGLETIPIRIRAASNPGGIGHDWVKLRFVDDRTKNKRRVFIAAKLGDNPHLDQEEYKQALSELDPVTRKQLLDGDWTARMGGMKFRREWFKIVDVAPDSSIICRFWDMASTEPEPGEDPDYTAGAKVSIHDGKIYIHDIRRLRATPGDVQRMVRHTAEIDGRHVSVRMEQEPGSSGVAQIDHYTREVLTGYDFRGDKPTGPKEVRANPLSSIAQSGNVYLVKGAWISDFLDEADGFPVGSHDDQVDACSGALTALTTDAGFTAFMTYANKRLEKKRDEAEDKDKDKQLVEGRA